MNALVVLNYNDSNTTEKFIAMAAGCKSIDKIIVVDNHSNDGSYEKLSELADSRIDVIQTTDNGGYARGNNFGVFYALKTYNPDIIYVSNPDVEFGSSIIEAIEHFYSQNPHAGIVSGKMINTSGIDARQAWKIPRYSDCILEQLILLKKIVGNKTWYTNGYFDKGVREVEAVSGSFFAITSEAFKAVNGFDENTFLYYEENILATKLKQKGYVNYILCDECFVHRHSESINKSISSVKKRLRIAYESRRYYIGEYLNKKALAKGFLAFTFGIGTFNYVLALKIFKIKR